MTVRVFVHAAGLTCLVVISMASCATRRPQDSTVVHRWLYAETPSVGLEYRVAGVSELDFETARLFASPNRDPLTAKQGPAMPYCLRGRGKALANLRKLTHVDKGEHLGLCDLVVRYLASKGSRSDCPLGDLEVVRILTARPVDSANVSK